MVDSNWAGRVRRTVVRAVTLSLLLVGLVNAIGCKTVVDEDRRGPDRDFHHDDYHHDHY